VPVNESSLDYKREVFILEIYSQYAQEVKEQERGYMQVGLAWPDPILHNRVWPRETTCKCGYVQIFFSL